MTAPNRVQAHEPRWRPIPFQGWKVRAIYEGRRVNQTRRLVKWPAWTGFCEPPESAIQIDGAVIKVTDRDGVHGLPCPFGRRGDFLWVRESWWQGNGPTWGSHCVVFDADKAIGWHPGSGFDKPDLTQFRKRSWMFMPRRASRLSLEIIDVRVQRLQTITEEDARSEGVEPAFAGRLYPSGRAAPIMSYVRGFAEAWDRMHGKSPTAAWASNPFVWAITFKRLEADPS